MYIHQQLCFIHKDKEDTPGSGSPEEKNRKRMLFLRRKSMGIDSKQGNFL